MQSSFVEYIPVRFFHPTLVSGRGRGSQESDEFPIQQLFRYILLVYVKPSSKKIGGDKEQQKFKIRTESPIYDTRCSTINGAGQVAISRLSLLFADHRFCDSSMRWYNSNRFLLFVLSSSFLVLRLVTRALSHLHHLKFIGQSQYRCAIGQSLDQL